MVQKTQRNCNFSGNQEVLEKIFGVASYLGRACWACLVSSSCSSRMASATEVGSSWGRASVRQLRSSTRVQTSRPISSRWVNAEEADDLTAWRLLLILLLLLVDAISPDFYKYKKA